MLFFLSRTNVNIKFFSSNSHVKPGNAVGFLFSSEVQSGIKQVLIFCLDSNRFEYENRLSTRYKPICCGRLWLFSFDFWKYLAPDEDETGVLSWATCLLFLRERTSGYFTLLTSFVSSVGTDLPLCQSI